LLTGSARDAQETRERTEALERRQQARRKAFELKQKRQKLEAEIAKMRADFELLERSSQCDAQVTELQEKQIAIDRIEMGRVRKADASTVQGNGHA
jgi:uncharacterized protein (DUF2344 family)